MMVVMVANADVDGDGADDDDDDGDDDGDGDGEVSDGGDDCYFGLGLRASGYSDSEGLEVDFK